MTFDQAIKRVEDSFTDLVFSGYAYKYFDDYVVEMRSKTASKSGGVTDGLFIVNGSSGKVKPYAPLIDGFHDLAKIEIYNKSK